MMYDNDNESFDPNEDNTEDEDELLDWQLPLCFYKKRHKNKIEGSACLPQTWRMKEKVKFSIDFWFHVLIENRGPLAVYLM